jgi:hypothetical protein
MRPKQSRAQKKAALARRTALSERNILENTAVECKRAIHRNKSAKSSCLRTNPNLLKAAVYVPPINPQQETKK